MAAELQVRPPNPSRQGHCPVNWLHWELRELRGSQAQGSQPRPLASFQWEGAHWSHLGPTTLGRHKQRPLSSSQGMSCRAPKMLQSQGWQPFGLAKVSPVKPGLQRSQRSPCTCSLHTHWPVSRSQGAPGTAPSGSHSQGIQVS